MPGEIDPSALSRRDSANNNGDPSSTPTTKTLTITTPATKSGKPTLVAPRVEVEPLYTSLKSAIGVDGWTTYKDALSSFMLGTLNLSELSRRIDPLIEADPARIHTHNQLICAIHINALRDAPEPPVAPWVSANDKPTNIAKPLTGDAAEARLKQEVMQLPPRTRHRLKGITDEPPHPIRDSILGYRHAKAAPIPSNLQSGGGAAAAAASAATANGASDSVSTPTTQAGAGLNKDTDIRRRFHQPLMSEARDLPASASAITDRILPIAYEAGLQASTPSTVSPCAEFMVLALETLIKEELCVILSRTRTDPPISVPIPGADAGPGIDRNTKSVLLATGAATGLYGLSGQGASGIGPVNTGTAGGVMTARYRQRILAEERRSHTGAAKRSELGLLPVEREALTRNAKAGTMGDLRIAWELGDNLLGVTLPWVRERVALYDGRYDGLAPNQNIPNNHNNHHHRSSDQMDGVVMTNGVNGHNDDEDDDNDMEWSWEGGRSGERDALSGLLDGVLGR